MKNKTITITPAHERDIVNFCDDELNYHINESGCPGEYRSEINAQIKLLQLLGHDDMAMSYKEQFKNALKNC